MARIYTQPKPKKKRGNTPGNRNFRSLLLWAVPATGDVESPADAAEDAADSGADEAAEGEPT